MSYTIHAIHKEDAEPVIETGERYISAFEGGSGDGWVLSVDRKTHEGTLMSNDIRSPAPVSVEKPFGDLILDPGEQMWLRACWMTILNTDYKTVEKMFLDAGNRLAREIMEEINKAKAN